MQNDRTAYRNVHIFDASDDERLLGGLHQNGSVTEANFLDMLEIIVETDSPLRVRDRFSCHEISRTSDPLEPGIYDVHGTITLSKEPWLPRLVAPFCADANFVDTVLARDKKCVISGRSDTEAAYIFPRDNEEYWLAHSLAHCITDMPFAADAAKLDSPQNGLALLPDVHELWNQYLVTVNPDDNYKVVAFGLDMHNLDGRTLDPACRMPHDAHRVADTLLRWHYHQAVLANVRGAGEPIFDGAPPGADALRTIEREPYARERFQMEISARLRGFVNGD